MMRRKLLTETIELLDWRMETIVTGPRQSGIGDKFNDALIREVGTSAKTREPRIRTDEVRRSRRNHVIMRVD